MSLRPFFLCLVTALIAGRTVSADSGPAVYSVSPGAVAKAKARLSAGDQTLRPAFDRLRADADAALKTKPASVMDKPKAPASGDKHDYSSQAPYFWPDPSKKDGLPYLRKDGHRNPESYNAQSDSPRFDRVVEATETLALAWYFTGNDAYAEHAARLLRVWFLEPPTRMNPNFNFAQAIPGVTTGRGTGMIESRSLIPAMNAAALLAGSKAWRKADQDALEEWMRSFLEWAQTSKNGKDEAAATNNHGSFYDVQIAYLALFVGQRDLAKKTIEAAKERRIAVQIRPDGSQPLELERVDSFGYSRFNIRALLELATLGEHVSVDLWRYQSPKGASIRKAVDFLVPYVENPDKPWPFEHGKKASRSLDLILWPAASVYKDERYRRLLANMRDYRSQRAALFYSSP